MPTMLGPVVEMLDRRPDALVANPPQPANRTFTRFLKMISQNVEDDELRELPDRAAAADAPLAYLGVELSDHCAPARGGRPVTPQLDRGRRAIDDKICEI